MSTNISKNKSFLDLLLTTSREQALSLLQAVTPSQGLLLTEIAYNLLLEEVPLPKKITNYIKKHRKLFVRIANSKLSATRKQKAIQKDARHVLFVLLALKEQLTSLL